MRRFLQDYSPRKLVRDVIVSLLFAGVTRLWFWLLQVPLEHYREVAFWAIVPISGWLIVALASFARAQLREQPKLTGQIDHFTIGPFPNEPDLQRCQIFMIVSLRNTGMPSSVEGWKLSVLVPGAAEARDASLIIARDVEIIGQKGIAQLSSEETLYDLAIEPIEKGRLLRGHLFFEYPMRADLVGRPGTVLTLSWEDVTGARGSCQRIAEDLLGQNLDEGSYPGLRSHRFRKHGED